MNIKTFPAPLILGISFIIGAGILGISIGKAIVKFKTLERSVNAKGLAERECLANVAIWSITFTKPSNNVEELYAYIERTITEISNFLISEKIESNAISVNRTLITDKSALPYSNEGGNREFRYIANQNMTVYCTNVLLIKDLQKKLPSSLGKKGIVFTGNEYENPIDYIFTNLNNIKPQMIQESTQKAREAAIKFAEDSKSKLGKIKNASQGQFTVENRDKNNPHIKKIRIVSTVEYYLSD